MTTPYKFGTPYPEDQAMKYANEWATEKMNSGLTRLVIAPTSNQIDLLIRLLEAIQGAFWLLYVLIVPRGGNEQGRYQSPEPQNAESIGNFLRDFEPFLELDGRHNLWIASESSSQRLIYDRHNVMYAYGPVGDWSMILLQSGFREVPSVRIPDPHSHHYHQCFDTEEDRMIARWQWHRSPLKPFDEE